MSDKEIIDDFRAVYESVQKKNPNVKWLFTVSPVKHLNDGVTENLISKGILLKTVYELTKTQNNIFYFPAYELVTEVLRDYRFFEKDMAHPNALATEFIWEKFLESVVSDDGRKFILRWKHIRQALNHKPLFPDSKEHQLFLKRTITDLMAFGPEIDVSSELRYFQNQLT